MTSAPDTTDHGRVNTDTSITSFDDDRLERKEFSRRVAERIQVAGAGASVTFGLSGAWGSGKTSVLNMIRLALEEQQDWAVVEFTPWATADLDALTAEFYEVIASAIPPGSEAGQKARRMLMASAPVAKAVLKAASKGAFERYFGEGTTKEIADAATSAFLDKSDNYEPTPDPFQQQFKAMSEAIGASNSQVLVIVDDLDRLHSDELLAVMKAVRLLGRFDGVHYLLSYDKRTVLDLIGASDLARNNDDRARAYLEKIVQYPFELPPMQSAHSRRELTNQLTAIAKRYGCELDGADATNGRGWNLIDELLTVLPSIDGNITLRAIYRWCSQVDVLMALVGRGHLELLDAALITYLRLRYEPIYDRLPSWRSELVGEPHMSSTTMATQQDRIKQWMDRFRGVYRDKEGTDLTEAYQILSYLFPKLPPQGYVPPRPPARALPVHDDEFFDRYFMFTLPVGDISDVTVREETSSLIEDGALREDSALRTFIDAGGNKRKLALRKLNRELARAITDTAPENALSALEHLWPSLLNQDGDLSWPDPSEATAVTLLAQSVDSSSDASYVREALNRLSEAFGLRGVAQVLSVFRRGHNSYPDPIDAALTDIREKVLSACMADLTSPVPPREGGLLSFVNFLTVDMYAVLRLRIDSEELTQLDVAARLLTRDGGTTPELLGFRPDLFKEIYARDEWDLDQFQDRPSEDDLPSRDGYSIEARKLRARYAMHALIPEDEDGQHD
ncbi:hypothetical protein G6031_00370 [Dietzia sp. CQ4]|uniref:KAP family P-loop NTPase fold protein n=1 Tax=Dietzia sp. (strain CQ4) TaxID=370437 RepID=UPI0015FB1152|nr:KAP family NTPase [Dietzia sp. CQ4]MBB1032851.1 hypothetical protein [Dietzia sp. CQ4]